MQILEIKDLTKNFYLHNVNREIKSCKNVNFSLDKGQFIGIVGLSGAGKSTILKCINRTYLATAEKSSMIARLSGKSTLPKQANVKFFIYANTRLDMFRSSLM